MLSAFVYSYKASVALFSFIHWKGEKTRIVMCYLHFMLLCLYNFNFILLSSMELLLTFLMPKEIQHCTRP